MTLSEVYRAENGFAYTPSMWVGVFFLSTDEGRKYLHPADYRCSNSDLIGMPFAEACELKVEPIQVIPDPGMT